MPFDKSQLALTRFNGQGPRFWSYNTNDSAGFVKGVGYFNLAAQWLSVGDWVFVESGDGSLTSMCFIMVVTGNSGGVVALSGKTIDV
jgi:hypothetical protein